MKLFCSRHTHHQAAYEMFYLGNLSQTNFDLEDTVSYAHFQNYAIWTNSKFITLVQSHNYCGPHWYWRSIFIPTVDPSPRDHWKNQMHETKIISVLANVTTPAKTKETRVRLAQKLLSYPLRRLNCYFRNRVKGVSPRGYTRSKPPLPFHFRTAEQNRRR